MFITQYIYQCRLVLRIRCDATDVQCPLGIKFGVLPEGAGALLTVARELGLNIKGVAFHVGSGCNEPAVFHRAIAAAKQVRVDTGISLIWPVSGSIRFELF